MNVILITLLLSSPSLCQEAPPKPESPLLFAKPDLFARHFSAPPRIPLLGDFNADGYADLACLYPPSGGVVDLSLGVPGGKLRKHHAVARKLGGKAVSCAVGNLMGPDGSDIAILFENGEVKVVHSLSGNKMTLSPPLALVEEVDQAKLVIQDFDRNRTGDILIVRPGGRWTLLFQEGDKFRAVHAPVEIDARSPVPCGKGVAFLGSDGRVGTALWTGSDWKIEWKKGTASRIVSGYFQKGRGRTLLTSFPGIPDSSTLLTGDVTGDGIDDLVSVEPGGDIQLRTGHHSGDEDRDGDGLSDLQEKKHKTDPLHRDTDRDGLLDGWEVNGAFGFDFPAEGFSPLRKDVLCFVQRRSDVNGSLLRSEVERAKGYYAGLPVSNPDSSQKGIGLHIRFLGVLDAEKTKGKRWRELGEANLPRELRGLAHYMVVSKGGGGQAARMGTMGGCGDRRLYEVFVHEFGHQLGLGHRGNFKPAWCPLYRSVMNYAYNYKKGVGYSTGRFRDVALDETNLKEVLPWPLEDLRFLEQKPYRFRIKARGNETLVDWNRNGKFDEGKVVADINTAYSTDGGTQTRVGKTVFAPTLAVLGQQAWLISISPEGKLQSRKYLGKEKWGKPAKVAQVHATGDPSSIGFGNQVFSFVPGPEGVDWYAGPEGKNLKKKGVLPQSRDRGVNSFVFQGRLLVILWNPKSGKSLLLEWKEGEWVDRGLLPVKSGITPGGVEDTIKGELLLGISANQGKKKDRWQVVRFRPAKDGLFELAGTRWVRGKEGTSAGNQRCQLFFETGSNAGAEGRLHFIATGMVKGKRKRACFYDVMTIGDKGHDSGWLQKRYYNEWATTRSPVAAAWFGGDLFLAFRWYDGRGKKDDHLMVAHHGLGIFSEPMGDFDDVRFVSEVGLQRSILWMSPSRK